MTRDEYLNALKQAVHNFETTMDDVEDSTIALLNDEFMLEVYECTGDSRRT